MPDYSQLSDAQLQQLWQVQGQETNHAPDSSTVQSPKGASGNMQVMGPTQGQPGFGVKPSNGTPEDTAREGQDYYLALSNHFKDPTVAAIAYNMGPGRTQKWLDSGADLSKLPDETLKYAYHFDAKNPGTPTYGDGGLSTRANLRGQAAIKAMAPDTQAMGNALTGVGQTMAGMASGTFGQAAGALHGAYDLATGEGYKQAHADLEKERDAVTYQPSSVAGQQISANVGKMFDDYLTKPLESGGYTVLTGAGLTPETAQAGADIGTSLFENPAPSWLHGMGAGMADMARRPTVDTAGAQLDALNAATNGFKINQVPDNGPNMGPQLPENAPMGGQPNAGPPRPPIAVNAQGTAFDPTQAVTSEMLGAEIGRQRQMTTEQNAAGDLFPQTLQDTTGQAEPYNPNRAALEEPFNVNTMEGQARLPLEDPVADKMQALRSASAEQLDIFSDQPASHLDQFATEPDARSLTRDEFEQTVNDLAAKDGTRFPVPEDMDAAFDRYTDSVRDEQGDMFGRATMAENFAKSAVDEALERRVNEHPTVMANQAKVDHLMAQDQSVPGVARDLTAAQDTLQKSQDNIRKFFEPTAKAAAPFYAKDGTVHMYTFGYLPEMMKSIGALLKGIHGVVFKTLDKMIPNFKNLDGMGKIAGQGIKDFVNKQANKDWTQTVNQQPKAVLRGVDGLRDGLKDYLPHDEDLSPEQLKAQMQSVPDISSGKIRDALRNNLLTGQQLQAFTHHPLVKYAVNTVDRAMRNAQQFVREQLVGKGGLREKVRAMNDDELTGIWSLMELNEGTRAFSDSELRGQGFSDKQVAFYRQRAELNAQKLQMLNDGRAQAGLKPIEARVAHIAGHFLGDFKTLIRDADGNVKAVIAHNTRLGAKTIANRVLEQLGEGHTMSPIEMRKMSEQGATDRYTGYMNILNDMAGRDPVVDKVVSAYRDYMTNDAQAAMKYRAAFKQKANCTGGGRKEELAERHREC